MSSVRMCDTCNRIFSENEEGWQSASLNTVEYDEQGRQTTVPIRQDLCSDCAVQVPRKKTKRDEMEARISDLEKENRRLDELTEKIEAVGTKPAT